MTKKLLLSTIFPITMVSTPKLYYCIYKNPIVHPNISVDENRKNVWSYQNEFESQNATGLWA